MIYLSLVINLCSEGLPSRDELELRWKIQDLIEEQQIAEVIGSEAGRGQMDIDMEVTDIEAAKSQVRKIAVQYQFQDIEFKT